MMPKDKLTYMLAISSVVAGMGFTSQTQAQVQNAGDLLVDVDATTLPAGSFSSIANNGTLGGVMAPTGSAAETPVINVNLNVPGVQLDGDDFLQLITGVGGSLINAPAGITGPDPTRSIEVWAFNPAIADEETLVSWGHRGGPDGSNMSFNYGAHPSFGAVGQWGAGPDIGWNNTGGAPAPGQWHHLVYTYDGTTTRVYSDGALANSEVLGAGIINTHPDTAINIGTQLEADGITPTPGLRGTLAIAKVRIHDGVLSDEQVANNYNEEVGTFVAAPTLLAAAPTHQYTFNDAPASDAENQIVVDSIGAADGIVLGAGTSLTGAKLTLPGGSSATQGYVDLPNGLLSQNSANNGGSGEFTFEAWFKNTGNQNWARIFDFGTGSAGEITGPGGTANGTDYLFYSAQVGGNVNARRLDLTNEDPPGGGAVGGESAPLPFNQPLHVVVTWDEATGQLVAYENGGQIVSLVTDDAMSDINDVNVWLGRSNWTGDSNTQGEYEEVRLYDRVLSLGEISGNAAAGPDRLALDEAVSIVSQPKDATALETLSASFYLTLRGNPDATIQWFMNGSPVADATGTSLTLQNVQLSDNGAEIYAEVTDNGNVITSDTATLSVFSDNTPPELVQARIHTLNSVEVTFSEPILAADASNPDLFQLHLEPLLINQPIPILSASPSADPARVILTVEGAEVPCGNIQVTVNGVRDASGADNEIAPDSTTQFFHLIPGGATHVYKFNNLPGDAAPGTVVTDLVGGADGDIKGAGATTTGDRVTLPGGGSATAAYIDLPNGLLSENSVNNGGSGQVTLEGWVRITGARTWSRIFDFGSSAAGEVTGPGGGGEGTDYLFLSAQVGDDTATHRLEVRNEDPPGGGIVTGDYASTGFNNDLHFVVTWNESTGEIRAYENGVLGTTIVTDDAISDINDVNVWLGRSNWTADQNAQGQYEEFRVYDRVLSESDVANNFNGGPESNFGLPGFLNFTVPSFTMQPGESQQSRTSIDFELAADVNITGSSCLTYESSDTSIATVDDRGVITAVAAGDVQITVTYIENLLVETLFLTVNPIPVGIVTQPTDQTVDEFGTAVFTANIEGTEPVTYQWYKNGSPIAGANSPTLTLNSVPFSDDGSTYYLEASNNVGGPQMVTTETVTLTVIPDLIAPEVVTAAVQNLAIGGVNFDTIGITFSEPVNANVSHFTVTGHGGPVALLTAQSFGDGRFVALASQNPLPCGQLTIAVSGVTDLSAAANSVAPDTSVTLHHFIPGGVTHLYNFNNFSTNASSGAVVNDLVGGANGTILGAGATFNGTSIQLPGGSSAVAAYVDLPNGLLSENSANNGGSGQVTIEGWVTITGARTWSRIFDFGSSLGAEVTGPGGGGEGTDYLFLSAQIGDDTANHRVEIRNEDPPGGGIVTADHASTAFLTKTHFALTWDEASGSVIAYENGVQATSLTTDDAMSDINDVNVWLGRSNWTGDQNMQGDFDEFRIYDRVLDAGELQASFNAGPESNYGELNAFTLSVDNSVMTIGDVQQAQISADFESLAGANMSGSPCWSFVSSDETVLLVDARGNIEALANGTATVTASFGSLQQSVTIEVSGMVNEAPVANADSYTVDEDTMLVVDAANGVLANDTDADGDPLQSSTVSDPNNGTLTLNSDGSFTYTPNADFNGVDTFEYVANDGTADSTPASVTITVNPINDPPVCSDTAGSGDEDAPISIELPASDVDGDPLTFVLIDGPANGSVSIEGNIATYTGAPNFCGTDSFTFGVEDPSGASAGPCLVSVTVNAVNDAPTATIDVQPMIDLGPTTSGLIAVSPDGVGACITLDGSLSSDPDAANGCGDDEIVSYVWVIDGQAIGEVVGATLCLSPGVHEITLLVEDASGAIGESTVTLDIVTACEATEQLVLLVEESVVERSNKRPFLATLKSACAAFDRGSTGAALNMLQNAFQNKVRAQIGRANPDEAEEWIRVAQEIVDAILAPQDCEGCE